MFSEFKEEVLIENLIKLCLGEVTLVEAKKHLRENCGLERKDYVMMSKNMLSNPYTNLLIDMFSIESCKHPKLLEMYLRSPCSEWLDVFCYEGTILSLLECAEGFKAQYDCMTPIYNRIAELEERAKYLELRNKIVCEKAGVPEIKLEVKAPEIKTVSNSFIYFIQAGDFCKIGYTKDVDARLAQLQIGCPVRLQLLHVYEVKSFKARRLEQKLHDYFKCRRVNGEWFNIDVDIEDFEELCCKFDM